MLCEFLVIFFFSVFLWFFFSGEIVSKPVNPSTDNYKTKLNVQNTVREGLQEYKNMNRQSSKTAISSETNRAQT
jgi:hypothetical protein